MHQGCFVWTGTRPLLGQRTPRRGPVRVCVCVLLLAGLGVPASRQRSGAPQPSFGRFVLLLCSATSGLGLPLSCPFVCLFPFLCFFFAPPLSLAFCGFRVRVFWAFALCGPFPPTPPSPGFCFSPVFPAVPLVCCSFPPALALLCAAARCAVFFGAAFCVLCCAVGCCCVLCRVSGRVVWLRCSHCGLLSRFGLRCRVLCRVVSLGSVLRRVAACCSSRCCGVVCCVLGFRSFGAAACCVVPSGAVCRPGVLCFPVVCLVGFLRAVCSVLCVSCCSVLVRAVVRRCALCCVCPGVTCCAFLVLSAVCGAVLRCAGAPALCCSCRLRCFWRLVLWCVAVDCAVSFGVLRCGAGSGCSRLSSGGVSRCRCPCLAAWPASLGLLWLAVVPCSPVS